ncbi:hypothetical protein HG530_009367 [Fusarium avenaceum]|nr:hypothetical protein HG530_009367 [Fusarium avenaceum]
MDLAQDKQENSTDELHRAEDGAHLEPSLVDFAAAFTLSLGRESLTSDKGLFLSNERIQLALVLSGHLFLSTGVAHLDLSLALAVLFQLSGSVLMKLGCRDRGCGLDKRDGEESKTSTGVDDVEHCTKYPNDPQEQNNDKCDEEERVFGGSQEATTQSAALFLNLDLIVLLMPEVGKGNNDQAQECIEAVQAVVDNLESVKDAVDAFGGGPILLCAKGCRASCGDERNVDRE